MDCPRAAMFDLDDTLAESFQAPTPEMISVLGKLLEIMPVAIITAASFQRMEQQFLGPLAVSPHVSRLYLFPNVATECYLWKEGWELEYKFAFTPEDHARIKAAIAEGVAETGIKPHPRFAPVILEREGKVAYAMIGLDATAAEKAAWDPDRAQRSKLKAAIGKRISDVEISIGGTTTIDITPKGVDKAYGVTWFAKRINLSTTDMLYVGDALFEGGNDAVVIPTGIETRAVSGPPDTLAIINDLLSACARS